MSQKEKVLAHLKRGRGLTAYLALTEFGCFRLAARIKELRDAGHDILTIRQNHGEKTFARYMLRPGK